MSYSVRYTEDADKALRKMDHRTAATIVSWISKNLVDCQDPFRNGKYLKGELSNIWRYRVGDYRIFSLIGEKELVILIIDVRHRRNAYK